MSDPAYNSYELKIKDSISGVNVNNIYNTEFKQTGFIKNKYIKAIIGQIVPLKLKLGKEYILQLKRSKDMFYDDAKCGVATCDVINVPFMRY